MKGIFRTTADFPVNTEADMVARCDIPFVPSVGDMLAITAHGDYWCVDDVFWHFERPDEVEVFVSDPGGAHPAAHLLKQGWQEA